MTDIDINEKLRAFFDNVVVALETRNAYFHVPGLPCFEGSCTQTGITPASPFPRSCNWKGVLNLVTRFWEHGPDVNDKWKVDASITGFRAEALHEMLIAIFIGAEKPDKNQARWLTISRNHLLGESP